MGGITPGSWKKGHHSMHDLRAAGLKSKRVSPWRHGNVDTPNTRRIRAQWNQQGTRRK